MASPGDKGAGIAPGEHAADRQRCAVGEHRCAALMLAFFYGVDDAMVRAAVLRCEGDL
jgi:hypothetical protein